MLVPNRADGETKSSEADGANPGKAFSTLNDPPRATCLDNAAGSSEDASKVPDQETESQADLRFSIGVVMALALPALIGTGVYVATTVLLRAS